MEQKKHRPLVYKYYQYLKKNCYGIENGVKSTELAKLFGIDRATQKYILKEINESPDLPRLISTYGSIYMCRTRKECQNAITNEIKTALTRLNKGKAMAKKLDTNGQYKFKFGEYTKDIIDVYLEK